MIAPIFGEFGDFLVVYGISAMAVNVSIYLLIFIL